MDGFWASVCDWARGFGCAGVASGRGAFVCAAPPLVDAPRAEASDGFERRVWGRITRSTVHTPPRRVCPATDAAALYTDAGDSQSGAGAEVSLHSDWSLRDPSAVGGLEPSFFVPVVSRW